MKEIMSSRNVSSKILAYMAIAFLIGHQTRSIYDTGNWVLPTSNDSTNATKQEQQHPLLLNNSLRLVPQFVYPTKGSRPQFSRENLTKCERSWDWPFLDEWEKEVYPEKKRTITAYQVSRSNAHKTAQGAINMQIIQPNDSTTTTMINSKPSRRVMIVVTHGDAMSTNAWHRIAVQYMVWIAWQVAEHRLPNLWSTITYVEIAMPCTNLADVPQGWTDLLFAVDDVNDDSDVTITNATLWCGKEFSSYSTDDIMRGLQPLFDQKYGNHSGIDAIIIPPKNGLLWDLAWDTTFRCKESHMFRTFMSQFAHQSSTGPYASVSNTNMSVEKQDFNTAVPPSPTVCWILRYGNPQRDIKNRDDVHGMLLSIFDTVRLVHITKYHTMAQIRNSMFDCHVLYGVHGAGMVNTMWGTMFSLRSTAIVELLPNSQPQYFRSFSSLIGHHYESIVTDQKMTDRFYTVDLDISAEALRRALQYVVPS